MLYNDEETRKEEERFQELLQYAKNLSADDIQKLTKSLNVLKENVKLLLAKPKRTKEEFLILAGIKNTVKTLNEELQIRQGILHESLFRQAYAYYQHVKKLAAEGNEEAKKVYEDLKVSYEEVLREQMGEN